VRVVVVLGMPRAVRPVTVEEEKEEKKEEKKEEEEEKEEKKEKEEKEWVRRKTKATRHNWKTVIMNGSPTSALRSLFGRTGSKAFPLPFSLPPSTPPQNFSSSRITFCWNATVRFAPLRCRGCSRCNSCKEVGMP